MNWLISKIIGQPIVLILLLASAFFFGAATGSSSAWYVQGLRLTEARQAHTKYVQDLMQQAHDYREQANRKREKDAKEYAQLKETLNEEIESGAVYRRCVAAGKCGVRKPVACSPSLSLPAVGGNNGSGFNTVPATGAPAAEVVEQGDPVVNDCAETTLRLNRLQAEIESQPGYSDAVQ